jgi:transcriptional regulatory protein LevR
MQNIFQVITNTSDNKSLSRTDLGKNKEIRCKHKNAAEIISKHLRIINMKRTIKAMRKTIQTLKTKINTDKYKATLNSIFTED